MQQVGDYYRIITSSSEVEDVYITNTNFSGNLTIVGNVNVFIRQCIIQGNVEIDCNNLNIISTEFKYAGFATNPYMITTHATKCIDVTFDVSNLRESSIVPITLDGDSHSSYFFSCCTFKANAKSCKYIKLREGLLNLATSSSHISARRSILISKSKCSSVVVIGGSYSLDKLTNSKHQVKLIGV